MRKASDSLEGLPVLPGYNEEANLSLIGSSLGSRSTNTVAASPMVSQVLKHICSRCEYRKGQVVDKYVFLPTKSCLTERLGLACISWIDLNVLQNDTTGSINITRDGWVRVLGTEKQPTSRHLMFELFQNGMCRFIRGALTDLNTSSIANET